jgi:hypothetical protein
MTTVLPMEHVFREAAAELHAQRMPVHYRMLTERAVERLGVAASRINWKRQVEDVREKMLCAGQYGTAYVGEPHCVGLIRSWFPSQQLDLLNADTEAVRIDPDLLAVVDGVVEGWQREEHMLRKARAACDVSRMRGLFRGVTIEALVREYFRAMWPDFYAPPDNEGKLDAWCGHDFKLRIGGRTHLIDVCAPKLNGSYAAPPNKPRADMHLSCTLERPAVMWRGVATAQVFKDGKHPVQHRSPLRMVVWLNTKHAKLPYEEYAAALGNRRAA